MLKTPERAPSPKRFDLDGYLHARKTQVESALARYATHTSPVPTRLSEAMSYSLLAGGKRLRPILTLAGYEAAHSAAGGLGEADLSVPMPVACALELIHTYSLIHHDLPSMDNDDFRRGRPTNHKVYGEAIAILAGDALLTDAFALCATTSAPADAIVDVVARLAQAAGSRGMVGGQVIDMTATGQKVDLDHLRLLHQLKTGALLSVAVCAGARLAGASPALLAGLRTYAEALGLAFQIIDDVLDVTADLATLGKDPGSDREKGKTTYVDLLGVDGARRHARVVMDSGLLPLADLGAAADPLRALADYTVDRKN